MLKLGSVLLLSAIAASAGTISSVDGITYDWYYQDGSFNNTSLVVLVDFGANISDFAYTIELPVTVVNPQIWGGDNVTWVNSYTANVSGTMPAWQSDKTHLTITVGWKPYTGGSGINNLIFTHLVDPPAGGVAGITQTPEPASILLTGLGLSLLALARLWSRRNSRLYAYTTHAPVTPGQ